MPTNEEPILADPSPYVGPEPFQAGQTIFGRSKEISELYYRLLSERIILFYSPSGAGKSSLIQAGLIPRLWEHFDTWRPTRVSTAPPGHLADRCNRFAYSVMLGLEEGLPPELRRPVEDFATLPLIEYVRNKPRHPEAPSNIFLFIDQFEEVLTNDPSNLKAKEEFFTQLGELLLTPDIWAILAIREDFLAALDPYASFIPTHLKNRFRLDRLSREAAMEAIEGPTLDPIKTNRQYMPGTVATLASNLAKVKVQTPDGDFQEQIGNYVEPVQLQVVCEELWGGMDKDDLTIDPVDVDRHGNVSAALSNYYEHKLKEIVDKDFSLERKIREWIDTYLITSLGLRNQVIRGKGHTQGLDNTLVEKLIKCHLVRPEVRGNSTWYELSHDRLINPIRNRNLVWYENHLQRFQKAAALWKKQDERNDALLLTGKALAEALEWEANNSVEPLEEEFLRKSKARQHQLDLEEKLRQEERDKAERARQRAWVYFIFAVVAVIGCIYAWRLKGQAEESTKLARSSLKSLYLGKARNALQAIDSRGSAMDYQEAWIYHMAAMFLATGSDPEIAGRLLQEDLHPEFQPRLESLPPLQPLWKAAFVPGTNRLLAFSIPSDGGKSEMICEGETWRRCGSIEKNIRALALSPDGKLALIRNREGVVTWQKIDDPRKEVLQYLGPPTLKSLEHGALAVNSLWAVLGTPSGNLQLFPKDQQRKIPQDLPFQFESITALGFRGAADQTLAVASNGKITILEQNGKAWQIAKELSSPGTSHVNAVSFWPDSKLIITGHADGYIRVWDLDARVLVAALRLHAQAILATSIDPQGKTLWTVSSDGVRKQTNLKPHFFDQDWELKNILAANATEGRTALYKKSCKLLNYEPQIDKLEALNDASSMAVKYFNRGDARYPDGEANAIFLTRSKHPAYLLEKYPEVDPKRDELLLMPDKVQDASSAYFLNAKVNTAFKVEFDYKIWNQRYPQDADEFMVGNGFELQFFKDLKQQEPTERDFYTRHGNGGYSLEFKVYPLDPKTAGLFFRDLKQKGNELLARFPETGVYTGNSWKHVCVEVNLKQSAAPCVPGSPAVQGVKVYLDGKLTLDYDGSLDNTFPRLGFTASSGDATSEKRIRNLVLTQGSGASTNLFKFWTVNNTKLWSWQPPSAAAFFEALDKKTPYKFPDVQRDQIVLTPVGPHWRANLAILKERNTPTRLDYSIEFEYSIHNPASSDPAATGQGLDFLFGKDLSQLEEEPSETELTNFLPLAGCDLHFGVYQTRSIQLRGPCVDKPVTAKFSHGLPDLFTGGPDSKQEWRKVRVQVETTENRVKVFYEGAEVIDAKVKLNELHQGIAFGSPAALQFKNEASATHAVRNIVIRNLKK